MSVLFTAKAQSWRKVFFWFNNSLPGVSGRLLFFCQFVVLNQVDDYVDVAASGFGVGTGLVCGIYDGLGNVGCQAGQAYVEARLEEVGAVGLAKVYFGVDGGFGGESDLHFAGGDAHGAFEEGRPAGGKQLFGVCAGASGAGGGEFNVQVAIGAAGHSFFTSAGGVGFSGVQYFFDLFHVVLRFDCLFHNLIFFDFFELFLKETCLINQGIPFTGQVDKVDRESGSPGFEHSFHAFIAYSAAFSAGLLPGIIILNENLSKVHRRDAKDAKSTQRRFALLILLCIDFASLR